jgi:hypothetical protein
VLQQTADIRVDRGEVRVRIDTQDRAGRFLDHVEPSVSVVEANGAIRSVESQHVAPGMYEAKIPIENYGEFMRLRVDSKDRLQDGKVVGLRNYAVVESYPPEYRAATSDLGFLEHTSAITGGRREPEASATLEFEGSPARGLRDLWRLCVLIAGLLLPLDIALRRLG